jgi:hypothetical protein
MPFPFTKNPCKMQNNAIMPLNIASSLISLLLKDKPTNFRFDFLSPASSAAIRGGGNLVRSISIFQKFWHVVENNIALKNVMQYENREGGTGEYYGREWALCTNVL